MSEDGLRRAIGEVHRRYTRRINFREKWRGYLWQGRFVSFVMDEPYLLAIVNDWRALLDGAPGEKELQDLRDHVRTSHPLARVYRVIFVNTVAITA